MAPACSRLCRLALLALPLAGAAAEDIDPAAPWLAGRLEPEWAGAEPRRTLRLRHDAAKSDEQNGEILADRLARLDPGDRLEIGPGRYSIARKLDLSLRGTTEAPIWIVAAEEDHPPIITRPDARQNVLDVGERSRAEFICFRGLELTGGSTLIRFHYGSDIWLDRCHLHNAGHEGITTNTRDTSRFFITRNHLHHFTSPGATGEAMYLGGNHGEAVMSYSVIAGNHVHDCGGTQGDGIELKQGSHHNWIVENHVHDTKYPCIIAHGTGGKGINLIERNVCYRSGDNVLQVQGEAIVRNNLLIDGAGAGFASTDHQGNTRRLELVHNTIVSRRRGANLSSWNDREGMVFANNLVYTGGGDALRFPGGSRGVTVAGNVIVGRTSGVQEGFVAGKGLEDFEGVTWDGEKRNATPLEGSAAAGGGDDRFRVEVDLTGRQRRGRAIAGAYDVAVPSGEAIKAGDEREIAGIRFCWCPPGNFLMGSPRGEPERRPGEDQVDVTLTKGFWIGKHEVTQGQWRQVVGGFPGELTAGEGDDFPVYAVNLAESEGFCRKLTERARASGELPEEWEFRLPTEAQWEYACRAGTTTATSFGDRLTSQQANFQGKPYNAADVGPSLKRAARVGSYPANPWGIHDMHGNVFEWCRDWYHSKLPGGADPDLHSAKGTATKSEHGGVSRVRRGGCWADDGWPCRSAFRLRFEPERRHDHIGFRVVLVRP